MSQLKELEIGLIKESPVALRSVNKISEKYIGLVDSVRRVGVLNPVLVREVKDANTGLTFYGLVDGLHRFSASVDAGKTTIPCHITSMEDGQVLEAQIIANVHKVETKPVEYTRQLIRILSLNPLMTLSELATKLQKSPTWLNDRFGLVKLTEPIQELVDSEKLNLSNAYALAKLPPEEQQQFVERALTTSPQQFIPLVTQRAKEIKDAKRQGRDPSDAKKFVAIPSFRKKSEVEEEMNHNTLGPALVKKVGATTAEQGFQIGVQWVMQMDPESLAVKKAAHEQRLAQDEADKQKRKAEREAEKGRLAQLLAERAQQPQTQS